MRDLTQQTIRDIRDFISIPSYHGNPDGQLAAADFLQGTLQAAGFSVKRLATEGPPYLIGHRPGAPDRSLSVYMMCDTRPPESDAREPAQVRSSEDGEMLWSPLPVGNKAASIAFLAALRAVDPHLAPSITLLAEGMEIIGSPGLEDRVSELAPARAHGEGWAFWPRDVRDFNGNAQLHLGYRGMLGVRLVASGSALGVRSWSHPLHSQFRPWVDAPVDRLVDALGVARSVANGVAALPTSPDDWSEVRSISLRARLAALGVHVEADDPDDAYRRLETTASLNVELEAAHSPGVGQIQPVAAARLQYRLPPGVTWESVLDLLRSRLGEAGLGDVVTDVRYGLTGAMLDPASAIVRALEASYRAHNISVLHWPVGLSTSPVVAFRTRLGLPIADGGVGSVAKVAGGEAVALDPMVSSSIERQIDFYRAVLTELWARGAPAPD